MPDGIFRQKFLRQTQDGIQATIQVVWHPPLMEKQTLKLYKYQEKLSSNQIQGYRYQMLFHLILGAGSLHR